MRSARIENRKQHPFDKGLQPAVVALQCNPACVSALHVTLLQVSFECNYRFNRDLRIWEPIVAQALTGDAGLKALLKSIGKNQVSFDCAFSSHDAAFM